MNGRGVTPVLGVVLLVGITVAGAMAMFVVGASLIGDSQERVQSGQVERSMVTVSKSAGDLHAGERTNATFSFEGTGDGGPKVEPNAGRLNITQYVDGEARTVVIDDRPLGALVYERGGTEYAYQSGGVWERSNDGGTRLVRNPSVRYGNGMLSFSFINVTGERGLGSEAGTVSVSESSDRFPTRTLTNPLENGTVMVEIESRYCGGWETHFRQQTRGAIVESCAETGETKRGELQVELIVPFDPPEIEGAVYAQEFDHPSGGPSGYDVSGDIYVGNPSSVDESKIDGDVNQLDRELASVDGVVQRKLDECDSFHPTAGGTITSAGVHCIEQLTGALYVDTTNGPVELVVRDRIDLGGGDDLQVTGPHDVTVFVDGDVTATGNQDVGNGGDVLQTRVFVSSNGTVEIQNSANGDFDAAVYAPDSDVRLFGQGTGGPVLADRVEIQNPNPKGPAASYDASMGTLDVEFEAGGPAVYYLHVDESQVTFTDR